MNFSQRIQRIEASKSVEFDALVNQLKGEGKDIIGLHVGELDFDTPEPIVKGVAQALRNKQTRYSATLGLASLRSGLAKQLSDVWQTPLGIENIAVSNGSKQCIYNVFQTLCNPGDEVIIPIPYWVTLPESVRLAGGVPILTPSTAAHQLDLKAIARAITPKTKVIVINSPNNPSGAVYPIEALKELLAMARQRGIFILADEAYASIFYSVSTPFPAIASLPQALDQGVVVVRSFSKSHCMTGFRIGYTAAHHSVIEGINKLQSHLTGNNCTFAQYGALAALDYPKEEQKKMVDQLAARLRMAMAWSKPLFDIVEPQGAFYLWAHIGRHRARFKSDIELAKTLLTHAGVAALPGSTFGDSNYIRICFASRKDVLSEGLARIKAALS